METCNCYELQSCSLTLNKLKLVFNVLGLINNQLTRKTLNLSFYTTLNRMDLLLLLLVLLVVL